MRTLFEKITMCNPNHRNMILRVLEEGHLEEKAFISDGRLVWESGGETFFSACLDEAASVQTSGITSIGGRQIFCEILGYAKKLVVCGAGHVALPVVQIGHLIGCLVTVLEDRPEFAKAAENAGADEVICEPFEEGIRKIPGDENTFFVIMTRAHLYDQICLEEIVKKEHAYIGMIGSQRKITTLKRNIIENGGNETDFADLHSPIGLDIGAETPEEIAVAVIAEVIREKNRTEKTPVYSREIVDAVLDPKNSGEQMVLVTIVAREGATPRAVGSRMLVFSEGKVIGTIGGGAAEAAAVRKASEMMASGTAAQLCHLDMEGNRAADDGMSCGGIIDVLLEKI